MARITIHVAPEGTCWQCKGTGSVCGGMGTCAACRDEANVHFGLSMPEALWRHRVWIGPLLDAYHEPREQESVARLVTRFQEQGRWVEVWPPSFAEMVKRI